MSLQCEYLRELVLQKGRSPEKIPDHGYMKKQLSEIKELYNKITVQ